MLHASSSAYQRKAHRFGASSDVTNGDSDDLARELARIQTGISEFASGAKDANAALAARLAELEQKYARRSGPVEDFDDNALTALASSEPALMKTISEQPGKAKLQTRASLRHLVKSITADNTGGLAAPARGPIANTPTPAFRLLEVLPSIPFAAASLEYPALIDPYVPAADYQLLESDLKPESAPDFDLQTATIVTITHWLQASKQILADAPLLQVYLTTLLRNGVLKKTEAEIINGTGVGRRLKGLLTVATAAVVTALKPADAIGEAGVSLASAGWTPDLCILNPADEFKITSERGTDGQYVAGGWAQPNQGSIWTMTRVTSPALVAGTALVLDRSSALILDRQAPIILASTEDRDNFIRNLVTLLGEIRLGLALLNPKAILKVTLPA